MIYNKRKLRVFKNKHKETILFIVGLITFLLVLGLVGGVENQDAQAKETMSKPSGYKQFVRVCATDEQLTQARALYPNADIYDCILLEGGDI